MKTLVSIAALGAALAAVPSTAQSYGYPGGGYGQQPGYGQQGYGQQGYGGNRYMAPSPPQVRDMVERAIQRGEVSRGEARRLREDVRELYRLDERTRRYGGNQDGRREVQRRTFEVLRELRDARNDGDRYGDRGRDDHDRDGRYGDGRDGGYPPPPPPDRRGY